MFNPYAIIAALLFAVGLFGAGVSVGYKYEAGANARSLVVAQDTAIKSANAAASAEIERTVARAKTEADERVKASTITQKGVLDAIKKSRPECSRDATSLGLLQQSIDAANGKASTSAVVSVTVRPVDGSLGRLGVVFEKLGVQGSGASGTVPPTPR